MVVEEMYLEFRSTFPKITAKADKVHVQFWGDLDPEFSYSWFESLAKAINNDMENAVNVKSYLDVFEFLRRKFLFGTEKEKECIDVAFTENLFWQIAPDKAKPYWAKFPPLLQDLYVKFHGRTPA